ncbi:hypothetical protein RB213_013529, partial [Colletotrichum asianum]
MGSFAPGILTFMKCTSDEAPSLEETSIIGEDANSVRPYTCRQKSNPCLEKGRVCLLDLPASI